jgi:(2Fe-2S) ferredoxin
MHRSIQDFLALGREGLSRFWSDIPSINTDCELTAYRDRQWSRKVQPNDVRDLAQLAIAVPYCDAVVVEKFWKRAITETGLGQRYGTSVFSSLAEVPAYLDSERKPKW